MYLDCQNLSLVPLVWVIVTVFTQDQLHGGGTSTPLLKPGFSITLYCSCWMNSNLQLKCLLYSISAGNGFLVPIAAVHITSYSLYRALNSWYDTGNSFSIFTWLPVLHVLTFFSNCNFNIYSLKSHCSQIHQAISIKKFFKKVSSNLVLTPCKLLYSVSIEHIYNQKLFSC